MMTFITLTVATLLLFNILSPVISVQVKCRTTQFRAALCEAPPVESNVDLKAYTGLWHLIYASGDAAKITSNKCVTANYTLEAINPISINVLNCQFQPSQDKRPQCVAASAGLRPNAKFDSQLEFKFFPSARTGKYNIAALVGDKKNGYEGAAVFSCDLVGGVAEDGFFFLARSPYANYSVMKRLIAKLRCNGFQIKPGMFTKSVNGAQCKYISAPEYDFDLKKPGPPFKRGE